MTPDPTVLKRLNEGVYAASLLEVFDGLLCELCEESL